MTTGFASAAIEAHGRHWNAGDQRAWTALFTDTVTFDDPVGAPTKHGRDALRQSWERAHTVDRAWRLVPTRIVDCGEEAAVIMRNEGVVDGRDVVVESIEIWRVNANGLVTAVRAYFTADPAVNDEYFLPEQQ